MQQGHHDNRAAPRHGRDDRNKEQATDSATAAGGPMAAHRRDIGDGAWLSCGVLLTCGAVLPSLTLCASGRKVGILQRLNNESARQLD